MNSQMTPHIVPSQAVYVWDLQWIFAEVDWHINILRLRQYGRHFPDDIFKCIFLNENEWILIKILLKFIPECPINNISSLVQIMAWRRPGDKPLSEPTMVSLLTHICITRPQWVKRYDNLGWGNVVSSDGTMPLSKPKLTYHQLGQMAITRGQFNKKYLSCPLIKSLETNNLKFYSNLPQANELISL